jgi:tRNA U34 5-methylaminomethyl-2-thiouridine-forming methyltransferase MnmC
MISRWLWYFVVINSLVCTVFIVLSANEANASTHIVKLYYLNNQSIERHPYEEPQLMWEDESIWLHKIHTKKRTC